VCSIIKDKIYNQLKMYVFKSIGLLCLEIAEMCFVPAKGKEVHSGNIEAVSTKEKAKFPQDFFPEVRLHCNRYSSI
jgi:hypothetical protein